MPLPFQRDQLAQSTRELKDRADQFRLSPRVKLALRMYAYGACKTLTEAAEAVGLNIGYLSIMHNSVPGQEFMKSAEAILEEKALEGTALMDALGRRGLEIIAQIAESGKKEDNQLRAAVDLADRSPTYSKVQKHQIEAITLTGRDAKMLAEALVAGKSVHDEFRSLVESGDFNRIEDGSAHSGSDTQDS
jgi:hypothetical protein